MSTNHEEMKAALAKAMEDIRKAEDARVRRWMAKCAERRALSVDGGVLVLKTND